MLTASPAVVALLVVFANDVFESTLVQRIEGHGPAAILKFDLSQIGLVLTAFRPKAYQYEYDMNMYE